MAQDKSMEQGKQAALEEAMRNIKKSYGEGAVMLMDHKSVLPRIETCSTGSPSLDIALGGGLPYRRVVEFYGPESSGKTTLSLLCIAQCQKQGKMAAFIDAEHALDMQYAQHLGVLKERMIISQPSSGEEALSITETLVRSGSVGIIVIDSVAALVPQVELEGELTDMQPGLQARMMSKALRRMTASVSNSGCIVVFINQLRQKIGVIYGSNEVTTGGNALKFYASIRLDIRKIGQVRRGEEIVGNRIRVKVVKNKVAQPYLSSELEFLYESGLREECEILDMAVKEGFINKAGSWYSIGDEKMGQGHDQASQFLSSRPQLLEELKDKVRRKKLPHLFEE